jgi:hypothetical protein
MEPQDVVADTGSKTYASLRKNAANKGRAGLTVRSNYCVSCVDFARGQSHCWCPGGGADNVAIDMDSCSQSSSFVQ